MGDYCNQSACVIDTRPKPNCSSNSDCAANQDCVGGYRKFKCNTNLDCEMIDARIPACSMGYCASATEANPQCTSQADCPAGQDCVGNVCK